MSGMGSAEPMSETPESSGVEGKAARKGRSMLRPFWRRSVVWEGVRAGARKTGGMAGCRVCFWW